MPEPAETGPWRGYFVATVTPFQSDLSLDLSGLEALLNWHLEQGVHGIVIAGTTGEWFSLSAEERQQLFVRARAIIPERVPLVAGCSALTAKESAQFIQQAACLHYSAALITPPPYIVPTDDEILAFYRTLAETQTLPIIVYNWPLGIGRDMSPELLAEIVAIPGVVALKNSTPDLSAFLATARLLRGRCPVFGVMPSDLGLGILSEVGGDGCIGAAGVLGSDQPGFFEAFWKRDLEAARRLGSRDHRLMSHLFHNFCGIHGNATATFKYLLRLRGLPSGPVRPPLLNLTARAQEQVRALAQSWELL